MANGVTDYNKVTETTLHRVVDDHYDLIQIISRCPECFEAYKSLIQKKRLNFQEGGLTVDSSQQKDLMLNEQRGTII